MLHITILCVGRIKEQYMKEGISDYSKRMTRYAKVDFIEIPEEINVKKEGEKMLAALPANSYVIALDLKGKLISSQELAEIFDKEATMGASHFTILIGGSDGYDPAVLELANVRLCMSKMTFTHQMARFIIMEQIYRAMKINSGEKYHK